MAFTEEIETKMEIMPDGQIQVLTMTIVKKDGVEIARQNHRHVVDVGDDTTNEAQIVKDVSAAIHTPERINARAAVKAALQSELS